MQGPNQPAVPKLTADPTNNQYRTGSQPRINDALTVIFSRLTPIRRHPCRLTRSQLYGSSPGCDSKPDIAAWTGLPRGAPISAEQRAAQVCCRGPRCNRHRRVTVKPRPLYLPKTASLQMSVRSTPGALDRWRRPTTMHLNASIRAWRGRARQRPCRTVVPAR
jgi:hypothetical protein